MSAVKYFDIKELSKKTGYSVNTLYKKTKALNIGYKPNNGKILFDDSCVELIVKGENNGKSISENRQLGGLDNIFIQK